MSLSHQLDVRSLPICTPSSKARYADENSQTSFADVPLHSIAALPPSVDTFLSQAQYPPFGRGLKPKDVPRVDKIVEAVQSPLTFTIGLLRKPASQMSATHQEVKVKRACVTRRSTESTNLAPSAYVVFRGCTAASAWIGSSRSLTWSPMSFRHLILANPHHASISTETIADLDNCFSSKMSLAHDLLRPHWHLNDQTDGLPSQISLGETRTTTESVGASRIA
ncbi:hypothetical protein CI109_103878 [Kwoniella shandongensis]|uniref:Uncharacterized protein n=1 Tax=Kwoniella shandongensis TaxID=1734106 RepID=A0A5M6C7J1_9TREE|nr:uncharacterized protein CI109_000431 [Kwoniella shandongensis]KAA5530861.1 hypothetical protein CI109_000431 [Kwoniella shandongensis]